MCESECYVGDGTFGKDYKDYNKCEDCLIAESCRKANALLGATGGKVRVKEKGEPTCHVEWDEPPTLKRFIDKIYELIKAVTFSAWMTIPNVVAYMIYLVIYGWNTGWEKAEAEMARWEREARK